MPPALLGWYLHSILTILIPSHTFLNAFANFDPKITLSLFLDSAQSGILKTIQNNISWCLVSQKLKKKEAGIIFDKTHHFNYNVFTTVLSITFYLE